MSLEFDIGVLPNRPLQDSIDLAVQAEDLGYGGFWVADSHSVMRDAYTLLAALALKTKRMRLATGVTHTVTRHPAVLANSWASLQELSLGRAVLGIGVGESAVFNLGLKPEKLADFETKLQVIRALLRGDSVDYEGAPIQMAWSKNADIPIIMACSGPRSLQLGGRIADGILFQVGANPSFVQYALDNIRIGAQASGRELSDLKLYMRVACAVSNDRDRARDEVRAYASVAAGTVFKTVPQQYFDAQLWQELAHFKAHYDYAEHGSPTAKHRALMTESILDAVAIAGTPEEAIPRFQAIAKMGINGFVMPVAMAEPLPYLQTFAQEVMPALA